jgi:two-component system nitrate/nitrite response regulator NarL
MRTGQAPWQANSVNPLRCVIVDDDASFLDAAQDLLEADAVSVSGTASSAVDALERVAALNPDVVLIDIRLGAESGFDAARQLAAGSHPAAVIMISTHAEADYVDLITESPAIGFLPKAELSGQAIRRILG